MANEVYNVNDATALQSTGIGTARAGSCVHAALAAIGTGCTVAEYRERMLAWVASAKGGNTFAAYPSGGSADTVLRHLVTRVGKVRIVEPAPVEPAKGKARKPKASK